MPKNRNYPFGQLKYSALGPRRWNTLFDSTKRTVVYFVEDAETVTIVGYYDTISDANAAAVANTNAAGIQPKVAVNWWHSTIVQYSGPPDSNPDAREDYPSWIDAEPL